MFNEANYFNNSYFMNYGYGPQGYYQMPLIMTRCSDKEESSNLAKKENIQEVFKPLFIECLHPFFTKAYYEKFKEKHKSEIDELKGMKNKSPSEEILFAKVISKIGDGYIKPRITQKFDQTFFPHGMVPGNLYTITAQSGGGKTALAVNMTTSLILGFNPFFDENIRKPEKIIYISLEQDKREIRSRILSAISGVMDLNNHLSTDEINTFSIKDEKMKMFETILFIYELYEENVVILDKSDFGNDLSIESVLKNVENKLMNFEASLIILDQIVNIDSENPDCDNVSPMKLKSFSQSKGVPVVVITQMNKDARKANRKQDIDNYSGNDLRGSSFLEHQSTSILIFQIRTDEADSVDVKSVKSRYCKNGSQIKLRFHGSCNLFEDICDEEINEDSSISTNKGRVIV